MKCKWCKDDILPVERTDHYRGTVYKHGLVMRPSSIGCLKHPNYRKRDGSNYPHEPGSFSDYYKQLLK